MPLVEASRRIFVEEDKRVSGIARDTQATFTMFATWYPCISTLRGFRRFQS